MSNTSVIPQMNIERNVKTINAFKVEYLRDPKTFKNRSDADRNTLLVFPDGRKYQVSPKFFNSFSNTFRLGRSVFEWYTPNEVFERIAQTKRELVRITVDNNATPTKGPNGEEIHGKALTITLPSKAILRPEDVSSLITGNGGHSVMYKDGMVAATFDTPFPITYTIGKQDSAFESKFYMEFPLDAYVQPVSYLMLLRRVCTNGAVARTRAFRTEFSLGKDDTDLNAVLDRAISSFNNEEGYHSFNERLQAASRSWASLRETLNLHKCIVRGGQLENWDLKKKREIAENLNRVTGNPMLMYGIVSGGEPSLRQASVMPVKATVYELINFATEVATHHMSQLYAKNTIYGWVGDTIVEDFDLDNSVTVNPDFTAFMIDQTIPTLQRKEGDVIGL